MGVEELTFSGALSEGENISLYRSPRTVVSIRSTGFCSVVGAIVGSIAVIGLRRVRRFLARASGGVIARKRPAVSKT